MEIGRTQQGKSNENMDFSTKLAPKEKEKKEHESTQEHSFGGKNTPNMLKN